MHTKKRWYLVKFYYYLDVDQLQDPFGDHVLQHLTKPLFAAIKARQLADYCVFMRFSEGGAHIRMRFFIDPANQHAVDALINQHTDAYRARFAEYLHYEMRVSPVGEIINRKMSQTGDFTLQQPGTVISQFMSNDTQGLEGVDASVGNSILQDTLCQLVLDFFSLSPSVSVRKLFVRLLIADVVELLNIDAANMYRVLSFLKSNWVSYFKLNDMVGEYFEKYDNNKASYLRFFDKRVNSQRSYHLLPQRFHTCYRAGIQQLQAVITNHDILNYDDNGELVPASFMNVYSYFHLTHNRSDVSLFQEVFWAHVLIDYYGQSLNATQRDAAQAWLAVARQQVS